MFVLWRLFCDFNDLPDPGARDFTLGSGAWPLKGFVVRERDQVYAYLNRCPHAGHPLNFKPGAFFAPRAKLLMCSSHGALFEISTGHCVAGPCSGAALRSIPIERIDRYVLLAED